MLRADLSFLKPSSNRENVASIRAGTHNHQSVLEKRWLSISSVLHQVATTRPGTAVLHAK